MAGEIQVAYGITAKTLYAIVHNSVAQVAQSTTSTFVSYVTANLANYTVAMTEQGTASGYYVGTFPTWITAGAYNVTVYVRAGGSAAEGDAVAGVGEIQWDGTAVLPLSTVNAKLPTALTSDGNIKADTLRVGGVLQTAGDIYTAVTNIAVTSAALNAIAVSATYTTGTDSGGVANTATLDAVYDSVTDTAGTVDFYYQFSLGSTGQTAVGINWIGYVAGAVNTVKVYAYNWVNVAWDQIGNVVGIAGTVNGTEDWELTSAHTGTGGNLGLVRIRFNATGLVTSTTKTDRILCGYVYVQGFPTNFSSLAVSAAGGVTLADGVAHGGFTASLVLQQLVVQNASGNAVSIASTGANGIGIAVTGNGTAAAMQLGDGSNGAEGLKVLGAGSAAAINVTNASGTGITVTSTSSPAVSLNALTSGTGLEINALGASGHGVTILSQNGEGIHIDSSSIGISANALNSGAAIQLTSTSDSGLVIIGGGASPVVKIGDGNTGAEGILVQAGFGSDAAGVKVLGVGAGAAMQLGDGGSGAEGLKILGNTGLSGIVSTGGAGSYGFDATLSLATLASYFLTNSGTTYASAVAGSVVKEIATNAGGGGSSPWDEVRASHTTAGTFGEYVTALLADGVAHGGVLGSSTATLALRAIDVTRGVGTAVAISSSGGNGLDISGSSAGVSVAGGAGPGVRVATGGSNPTVQLGQGSIGGIGLLIMGGSGASGNAVGMGVVGYGSSAGVSVQGGSSGSGMLLGSDSSGGTGLEVKSPSGFPAVSAIANGGFATASVKIGDSSIGSATGLDVQGVSTGASFYGAVADALTIHGASRGVSIQSDAGDGINISATDGSGITIATALNFALGTKGISIASAGTGTGVEIIGDNGFGLVIGSNNTTAVAISAPAGTGIDVQALNNALDLSSTGGSYGFDATLSPATLASFFTTNSGTTYSSAVAGSVVKEILGTGSITDASFSVPSDGTGQATGMLSMLLWLYHRFFGKVKYDKIGNSLITYQADGTTPRTTQVTTSNVLFDEIDAAP